MPYMCDPRHCPDTLFLVAEEDFRLWPADEEVDAQGVAAEIHSQLAGSSSTRSTFQDEVGAASSGLRVPFANVHARAGEPVAPAQPGPSDEPGHPGEPVAPEMLGWERVVGEFFRPASKSSGAESRHPSQEIQDVVKMVTAASRRGVGDLVWLSWDGFNRRGKKQKPQHAATLIAVSLEGAWKLRIAFAEGKFQQKHWDVTLLAYLYEHGDAFRASYVFPSIGSYKGHVSGSEDTLGWRPANWEQSWVQAGTRASDVREGATRWIARFAGKGLSWVCQVPLPEVPGSLDWMTLKPEQDEDAMEWLEWSRKEMGAPASLTDFAAATQTLHPQDRDFAWATTKRAKRRYRSHMAAYARRIFTDDPEQAVWMPKSVRLCCFLLGSC